jgi:hypothetical protein
MNAEDTLAISSGYPLHSYAGIFGMTVSFVRARTTVLRRAGWQVW